MAQVEVGIIGLGNMGCRIAGRIQSAGHALVGYDLDGDKARACGIPLARSIASVVEQATTILLSLPDSTAVEAVVTGPRGIVESGATAGQVVVDLSTSKPSSSIALHDALDALAVEFVDAGISGGAAAAERGQLTIMAGGSEEVLDRLRPILSAFSAKIAHMGDVGTGHTAKVLNNFLNGLSLTATAEVMVAARKADLDLETFLDVLNSSSGINFATLNRFPAIIKGDYLEGGLTSSLMMKDLLLYLESLQDLGMTSLNASGCIASFGVAGHLGYAEEISNRVVDGIGDLSGGVRLHSDES